jgi:hypothetical protein
LTPIHHPILLNKVTPLLKTTLPNSPILKFLNPKPKIQQLNNISKSTWASIPTHNRFQALDTVDLDISMYPTLAQACSSPKKESLPKTYLTHNPDKNQKKRLADSPVQSTSSSSDPNFFSSACSDTPNIKPVQQYIKNLATVNLIPKNQNFDFKKDFQPISQPYVLQNTNNQKFNQQLDEAVKQNHNIPKPLISIQFSENKIDTNILITATKNSFSNILIQNNSDNINQTEIVITDIESFFSKNVTNQMEKIINYAKRCGICLFLTVPQNEVSAAVSIINKKFSHLNIEDKHFFHRALENSDPV